MPLYEYVCSTCKQTSESIQKFSDPPLTTCPRCRTETLGRVVSKTAFQLKGSGWYATDYKKGPPAPKPTGSAADSTAAKAEPAKTEGTPTAKAKESATKVEATKPNTTNKSK